MVPLLLQTLGMQFASWKKLLENVKTFGRCLFKYSLHMVAQQSTHLNQNLCAIWQSGAFWHCG